MVASFTYSHYGNFILPALIQSAWRIRQSISTVTSSSVSATFTPAVKPAMNTDHMNMYRLKL